MSRPEQHEPQAPPGGGALARLRQAEAQLLEHGRAVVHYVEPFLTFCAETRELSPHTVAAYRNALMTFAAFCDAVGVPSPSAVHVRTIEAYITWLRRDRGVAATTVQQHRAALSTLWRFLRRDLVVTTNPAADAYGPRVEQRIPDFLGVAEQEHVLLTMFGCQGLRRRQALAIVATGILAGLRVSELSMLRLEHLHLDDRILKVVLGKGRKDRIVPVVPVLADLLLDHVEKTRPRFAYASRVPFVFVSPRGAERGEPLDTRSIGNIVARHVAPIIGRRISPHALRHGYAVRLLAGGADVESVRQVMGHSRIETTQRYLHIPTLQLQQNVAAWLVGETPVRPSMTLALPAYEEPPLRVDVEPIVHDADGPPRRRFFEDRAAQARLRQQRRARRRPGGR